MPIGSKRMSKLYRGTNVATRPIPRDMWSDDIREEQRNAVQTRTVSGPSLRANRGVGAPQIAGRRIRRTVGGSSFNPVSNSKQR